VRDALVARDEAAELFRKIVPLNQQMTRHATLDPYLMKILAGSGGIGAGEGIRTLDPNLGKVVLYP
jgi:hypothetical protein